jgi:predicted ferric reductase
MSADHTFWYLTRAAGFVAYLLLFASVALGLLLTTSVPKPLRRFEVFDMHRFLALLALGVTTFHMLIVLPDGFIGFSLRELLVPFASPYAQVYMALGTLSLYLMAIVIGTFYLRPLVPYSAWRTIHYTTFAVFGLALVHGLGAGTDTSVSWALALYAVTGGIVLALLTRRVTSGSARGIPVARPATGPRQAAVVAPATPPRAAPSADAPSPGYRVWARPEDR